MTDPVAVVEQELTSLTERYDALIQEALRVDGAIQAYKALLRHLKNPPQAEAQS